MKVQRQLQVCRVIQVLQDQQPHAHGVPGERLNLDWMAQAIPSLPNISLASITFSAHEKKILLHVQE